MSDHHRIPHLNGLTRTRTRTRTWANWVEGPLSETLDWKPVRLSSQLPLRQSFASVVGQANPKRQLPAPSSQLPARSSLPLNISYWYQDARSIPASILHFRDSHSIAALFFPFLFCSVLLCY